MRSAVQNSNMNGIIVDQGKGILIRKRFMKHDLALYGMLALPLIIVFIFKYIPMFGLIIAFQRYNFVDGFLHSPWVGLKWFEKFLTSESFFTLFRNTVLLSVYHLLWGFPVPIIVALAINEVKNVPFKRLSQTLSYLPHFLSTVIVVGMMMQLLSPSTGIVNNVLKSLGFEPIYFMIKPGWFRTLYISSDIWQSAGWGSIIYLAALTSIDPQLYEAAVMDGANRFKRILYITIPGIAPTIAITLILNIGHMMDIGFEKVLLMYTPLTYETADIIDTFVYRGLQRMDYSYATTIGLFKGVINLILIVFANSISRKISDTSLW